MRTIIPFLTLIILLMVSCQKPMDKKSQLEKLKKERDLLTQKINKLQEEINKNDPPNLNLPQVAVEEVRPVIFKHYIDVQGKVDGEDNIAISPKTLGVITNILVNQGEYVHAGQILAQMDDEVLRESLQEVKTQLQFATNLYIKQKNLWDQKIGSEVQYLTAKNNKEALEARLNTLQNQINMSKITSPINGTIEDVPIKIGQSVAPGYTAFRVINFSSIKIVADVAESYASKISPGDSALVVLPDIDQEIPARISFSSKYINPVNRTFTVEVRLKPGKTEYRANMIAGLKINDYKSRSVVVPVNLVQVVSNNKFVYVVKKEGNRNIIEKRDVKTGISYNGKIEILSGLNEGDLLITTGFQDLNTGAEIRY